MTKNTGGQAFPTFEAEVGNFAPGMTLRDYFAGQVLNGFVSNHKDMLDIMHVMEKEGSKCSAIDGLAELSYNYADAMLKERGKDDLS